MVIQIVVSHRYKDDEYESSIIIDDGVDYAYFKAVFDTLIEKGVSFRLKLYKEQNPT